jgi:hypothetical protein
MITVQEAAYREQYKIWIKFNTGESGIADLSDLIDKFAAAVPLKNENEFKKFYLDEWPTLAWPNGFDLSPETLYERVTGKKPSWAYPLTLDP